MSWYSIVDDSQGKSTLFVHSLPLQLFPNFSAYAAHKRHHPNTASSVAPDNHNATAPSSPQLPTQMAKTAFSENEQLRVLDSLMAYMQLVKTANLQPSKLVSMQELESEYGKALVVAKDISTAIPPNLSIDTTQQTEGIDDANQAVSALTSPSVVVAAAVGRPVTPLSRTPSFALKTSSSFRAERIEGTSWECPSPHVNSLLEAMDRSYVDYIPDDLLIGNIEALILSMCSSLESLSINSWLKRGHNVVYLLPEIEKTWTKTANQSISMSEILKELDTVKTDSLPSDGQGFKSSLPGAFVVKLVTSVKRKRKDQLRLQNDQCPNCYKKIEKGILSNNARFCNYVGKYFCKDCHRNMTAIIPPKVLLNWDFHAYKVCEKSREFLERMENIPCYRLNHQDVTLPRISRALLQARVIRTQLGFLRDYFQSCRFSDNTWGNTLLGGRTHLASTLDTFSVRDMRDLENNTLIPQLRLATQKLISHVLQCPICRMKGFICEICNDPRVIFPFQLRIVAACPDCRTFYHRACFKDVVTPCPKCLRQRKRLTDSLFLQS